MPSDPGFTASSRHRVGGGLRSIIADNHPQLAMLGDQVGQFTHEQASGDLGDWHRPQVFPGTSSKMFSTRKRQPQGI